MMLSPRCYGMDIREVQLTVTDIATPIRFEHNPKRIPDELKEAEQWVLCDENKVPLMAVRSGAVFAASTTDSST